MFLQKLLDPEDAQQRRIRRARIVRRNRIKREVAKGLPLRKPRVPRAGDYALNLDSEAETEEWNGPKSPFRPSFGGNSDDSAQQRQTAISLGATSSLCWRRLAESYHHMWEDGGEWEILWACRAAYEQALTHVAVACSPLALLAYAKVLESLGSFTGALTICASILQTFPNFDQLREVKLRFVLLQRYQLFSSSTDPATKRPVLTKCIGYTQELLLDKVITETKLVHVNVDILFQELYKLATKTSEVAPPAGIKWKAWKSRSETYTAFAEYFRAQGESVLASDALSRSLELLEESDSSQKPANRWRGLTEEQRYKRAQLYVVLARNYYQCNQMEKAIRSMEACLILILFMLKPVQVWWNGFLQSGTSCTSISPLRAKASIRPVSIATTAKFVVNWQFYCLMYEYRFFREDCAALRIQWLALWYPEMFSRIQNAKGCFSASIVAGKAPDAERIGIAICFQAEVSEQHRIIVENASAMKIQRLWRWYTAGQAVVDRSSSQAQVFLVEHLFSAQRRQTTFEVDLDHAARKIQAVYRGKRMRRFLRMLRARVPAPPCASPIAALIHASGALLGAALAINSVLENLDLHGNLLCDGAAVAIANDGLAHNKTLRYLNLAENRIGSSGGKALFRCLSSHNRSLQTLILRNNYLMNDVVSVLIETWQLNAAIESVELAGNLISDRFVAEIESAAMERLEVSQSTDNHELRLFLQGSASEFGTLALLQSEGYWHLLHSIHVTRKESRLQQDKEECSSVPEEMAECQHAQDHITNRLSNVDEPTSKRSVSTATFPLDKVIVSTTRKEATGVLDAAAIVPTLMTNVPMRMNPFWNTIAAPGHADSLNSLLTYVCVNTSTDPTSAATDSAMQNTTKHLPVVVATNILFYCLQKEGERGDDAWQVLDEVKRDLRVMLSRAESALRTLKNRPKVTQPAVDTALTVLQILSPSKSLSESPTHTSDVAPSADEETRRELLQQELQTLLLHGKERWEPLAVFLVVVRDLLSRHLQLQDLDANTDFSVPTPDLPLYVSTIAPLSDVFVTQTVKQAIHQHMEYYESRVRMAVAKLLGVLAKWDLHWVTQEFTPQIVDSVVSNLSRSPDFEETGFDELDDNVSNNGMLTPPQSPEGTPRTPSTPYRLDDVSGWKALESSLCALKYIIKGSGVEFLKEETTDAGEKKFVYLTPQILELVATKSCFHINRHVRVVGLDTITVLSDIAPVGFLEAHQTSVSDTLNKCIKRGMEDNWCQVRYAASISARSFLMKLQEQGRAAYLPILLPRLCLNRYYIAERVQKYSQESWRMIMGDQGREWVAKYANEIVDYYVEMTTHCVRESACQCIAELGMKVEPTAIRPHVGRLMQALLICFYDVSNLVRDAACLASAQLVLGFPEECRPFLDELYHLWIDHLSDDIWSKQPAMTAGIRRPHALGEETLSKQAFSCCSLEPKLFERHEHRDKEPWEHTDGAIYMVRELCAVAPDVAVKFLPQVADIAILRHFPQTAVLQETIWKQLPLMCEALGKKVFKRYLELFFDPLVFTLQGTSRLAKFAARDCVAQTSKQIGPSIFLGRLDANPTWKETLGPVVPVQPYMIK
ncbi:Leucine-rich repeat domain, L domain-like [Phytophthora cactorum]|nr:Leucine-rich repeat domain, L domain-like [Phytophthora cactorum]